MLLCLFFVLVVTVVLVVLLRLVLFVLVLASEIHIIAAMLGHLDPAQGHVQLFCPMLMRQCLNLELLFFRCASSSHLLDP